ncbi:HlyC/CorC family transporter [Bulleidia sp. zg-1006]|uniref:HlyC/CorC family transporter n=1 Tax=Bulleidia sp. zg-1006 TaxID=2806552 RepID=UPI001939335A|nr:hemolysin family protein [Bulleidia sp. zg-1006]QRG86091.1 HlyC/CorC family transporter [Bulleidia sp. zg-1006]
MTPNSVYLFSLIVLILFSGIFSAIETSFSSANKIRLRSMVNDGNENAKKVLKIVDDFDRFLMTVLIGNNIVNIASATIGTLLFTRYFQDKGPTISTIVITTVVLLFGEITPKSIAKMIPERSSCAMVGFVQGMIFLFAPFTWLLSGWKWLTNKMIPIEEEDGDITDDLITMVDEAEKEGDLQEHESSLISAAIEFNELEVKDVLTPRVDIVAVDVNADLKEIEETFRMNSYSRLPVYEETIDNIIGVIHEKDFYDLLYHKKSNLHSIITKVINTSPNTHIYELLQLLQREKLHMAVVLDEWGGTDGLITLEDIVEELVGEIWDEHDVVEEFYTKISENEYLVKGEAEVDDLFERFDIQVNEEEEDDYNSVSGWAIAQLEHIPQVNESFQFENLFVQITKADSRKVNEVRIRVEEKQQEEEE